VLGLGRLAAAAALGLSEEQRLLLEAVPSAASRAVARPVEEEGGEVGWDELERLLSPCWVLLRQKANAFPPAHLPCSPLPAPV